MDEEEIEIVLQPIDNYDLVTGSTVAPIDRLKIISADEYEACVAEWCVEYLKNKYLSVKKLGGAGDKGRDVVCSIDDAGHYDNYQCKYYASKLAPSNIWVELGKLVYYTFNGDFPPPNHYYFVSPQGLSQKLYNLVSKPIELRQELKNNWAKYCQSEITSTKQIQLSPELEQYIDQFDFSIVKELSPTDFIEQYKSTTYFPLRFGGGLTKFRPTNQEAPLKVSPGELVYIHQLLQAYGDYKSNEIKTIEELESGYPDLFAHLQNQRRAFFSAEALHRFVRDALPNDQLFIELKDDIYEGLLEIVNDDFDNGYERVKEVLKEVGRLQLSSIITAQPHFKFSQNDRKGLCHQLANEERFKWVKP